MHSKTRTAPAVLVVPDLGGPRWLLVGDVLLVAPDGDLTPLIVRSALRAAGFPHAAVSCA